MSYTYHEVLNEEFEKRKQFNSAYSLRAFARDLGLSAPRLSQIMNKKRGLSVQAAEELAKKLKLTIREHQYFCESVGELHARSSKERQEFKQKIEQYKKETLNYTELQLEYFNVISGWYHFAILELTYLTEFKYDYQWIADILGINQEEAYAAIKRMLSLNLVKEENGTLKDVFQFLATPGDVPSLSLKKFNSELMKKAMQAMYEQPVENREISHNIFAFRKEKLPEFKEKIRSFRRDLEREASLIKDKDSVYCLGIQFQELTRGFE